VGRYNELTGTGCRVNPQQLFNPNVLQLTNTKYLLTNIPQIPFLPNFVLAKGPVRNASGDVVYLYRAKVDNPYSWLTPVAVRAPDDQVLATVLNPRFDVKRAALFDTSARVRATVGVQALPAPSSVTTSVSHYEPGKVRIDLSAPAPDGASLVVSENYYPGWKATVDGKTAPIGRADYTFIGVELPAGARSVQLDFTSPTYERGKVITWIAILFGFLMLATGAWRDRRLLA
jgi:Bacterial membrane protein YfhO